MIRIECPECKHLNFMAHLKPNKTNDQMSLILNCMNCYHKITFNRSDSA